MVRVLLFDVFQHQSVLQCADEPFCFGSAGDVLLVGLADGYIGIYSTRPSASGVGGEVDIAAGGRVLEGVFRAVGLSVKTVTYIPSIDAVLTVELHKNEKRVARLYRQWRSCGSENPVHSFANVAQQRRTESVKTFGGLFKKGSESVLCYTLPLVDDVHCVAVCTSTSDFAVTCGRDIYILRAHAGDGTVDSRGLGIGEGKGKGRREEEDVRLEMAGPDLSYILRIEMSKACTDVREVALFQKYVAFVASMTNNVDEPVVVVLELQIERREEKLGGSANLDGVYGGREEAQVEEAAQTSDDELTEIIMKQLSGPGRAASGHSLSLSSSSQVLKADTSNQGVGAEIPCPIIQFNQDGTSVLDVPSVNLGKFSSAAQTHSRVPSSSSASSTSNLLAFNKKDIKSAAAASEPDDGSGVKDRPTEFHDYIQYESSASALPYHLWVNEGGGYVIVESRKVFLMSSS